MDYEQAAKCFMNSMKRTNRSRLLESLNLYSKGEMSVLGYLYHNDEVPTAPSELSRCIETSTARVASILNSLEAKKLVTREIDAHDRRKIVVSLTDEGRKVAIETKEKFFSTLTSIFEEMGEEDTKAFVHGLQRFVEIGARQGELQKN